jgi:hypothetical protein
MFDSERAARLRTIAVEMDALVRELGPKWLRLAHLRREAQQIIEEMEKTDVGR